MKQEAIGILGLGDLGKRLAIQVASAGFLVTTYSRSPTDIADFTDAVDPGLVVSQSALDRIHIANSAEHVLDSCSIIHWAIPSAALESLPDLKPYDTTVVLHDSVTSTSERALTERNDRDKFVIAHCLINARRRVIVTTQHDEAVAHFQRINLEPLVMSIREHDSLLAHSQGIAAILIHLGIKDELESAYHDGNLTPSGEELLGLLQNRQLNWTKNTMQSILSNPELGTLRERLQQD